jgi:hypothetical protein
MACSTASAGQSGLHVRGTPVETFGRPTGFFATDSKKTRARVDTEVSEVIASFSELRILPKMASSESKEPHLFCR